MKIGVANDHRGMEFNEVITKILINIGYDVINYGPKTLDPLDDYPDFAFALGHAVAKGDVDYGILVCRTGIGMSIACNKVKGVRCAKVSSIEEARLTRVDNNANVLSLSYELSEKRMKKIIEMFLKTKYSPHPRHHKRVQKIDAYEGNEWWIQNYLSMYL